MTTFTSGNKSLPRANEIAKAENPDYYIARTHNVIPFRVDAEQLEGETVLRIYLREDRDLTIVTIPEQTADELLAALIRERGMR